MKEIILILIFLSFFSSAKSYDNWSQYDYIREIHINDSWRLMKTSMIINYFWSFDVKITTTNSMMYSLINIVRIFDAWFWSSTFSLVQIRKKNHSVALKINDSHYIYDSSSISWYHLSERDHDISLIRSSIYRSIVKKYFLIVNFLYLLWFHLYRLTNFDTIISLSR